MFYSSLRSIDESIHEHIINIYKIVGYIKNRIVFQKPVYTIT